MAKQPHYPAAWCTDIGIQKDTNQDSALLLQAETGRGPILLAVLCDGMGGLLKGELASATAVRAFDQWFRTTLPGLLGRQDFSAALSASWSDLVQALNLRIAAHGKQLHLEMGTTIVALLLVDGTYYILNVGDSRVYLLADQIYQLTHDQTLVQREVDEGRMTPEQAELDARRSVLLQCVGASRVVTPDFFAGSAEAGQRFLLCCDGFRHMVAPAELYHALATPNAPTRGQMEHGLQNLVACNKARQETDNITAILVQA